VRGHADAETLAAFRAELLSRRKAARVSAHLAGCPRCATLDAHLAGVTALLATTTAPPMPDTLNARIEAALAAEAAARSTVTAAAPATAAGTARGAGRRGASPGPVRTRLMLRVATVGAAVAVIAGGGYGVAQLLSGSRSFNTGAASGAGSAARKGAIPGMSAGSFHPASGPLAAPSGAAAAGRVVSSGTSYQRATLGAQASAVLTRLGPNAHAAARRPTGQAAAPQNQTASRFPDLRACIAHVAGAQHPLLADMARYQGHPALILVLPGPPGTLRAVVVAQGCTATRAHILATAPLPR